MKLTVVSICLNAERFIAQMLSSVARQTWLDMEHIIVDGGSTDATLEIVHAHAAAHPDCIVLSGPDKGISDAMNKGLAAATGDVITFLHADDFYPRDDILQQVVEHFQRQPDFEWLTGGLSHVDSTNSIIRTFSVRRWSYRRLLRGNIIFHPATFIRREVLQEVGGYDIGLRYTMDYDLWLRLGRRSSPFLLAMPLAAFRVHPASCSFQALDAAFMEEFQVRCRYLQGKPLQQGLHWVCFWLKYLPNRLSLGCPDAR
jgi:glycosyltransferase involved in cell wall biosynthesis